MADSATVTGRTEIGLQFPRREPPVIGSGDVPRRVVTQTFDLDTLLHTPWFGTLAPGVARPNVLILCPPTEVVGLLRRVEAWAVEPCAFAEADAGFSLPPLRGGTLVVHDVSRLTVPQQITLSDWMTARQGATQVIAITSQPLAPLVEAGLFLQALYYRLNIVQAKATPAAR